jgi:hypothetical protein
MNRRNRLNGRIEEALKKSEGSAASAVWRGFIATAVIESACEASQREAVGGFPYFAKCMAFSVNADRRAAASVISDRGQTSRRESDGGQCDASRCPSNAAGIQGHPNGA